MALNSLGNWDQIHEQRINKEEVIDIRLKRSVTTEGIKLVVRKTTDDTATRRKNMKFDRVEGQQVYTIHGDLKAPAQIAEIRLFGYADAAP